MKILKKLNPDVAGITPYSPGKPISDVARELGLDPADIIKLASNESALGCSPRAIAAMHETVEQCYVYPDGAAYDLRRKIADRYGVEMDQVLVGNGSNEILELVGHCFMNRNTSTVFSAHSFVVYKLATQLCGARMIEVPMAGGLVHDIEAMVERIEPDTSVLFICNPNNPTGTMISNDTLMSVLPRIPDDVLVVIDEAYSEVALAEMPDTLAYAMDHPNVVICHTFSKGYGLAGLRLGYGIGAAPVIRELRKAGQPFNVNLMAQAAGVAALDDDDFVQRGREVYREARAYIEASCGEMQLDFVRTTTNFMLIDVGDGAAVAQRLLERGVIIRAMVGYGLPQYIRVTFGMPEQNQRFVESLRKIIKHKQQTTKHK